MDTIGSDPFNIRPGPYDVAAIHFAYAGRLQLANGGSVIADKVMGIKEQVRLRGWDLKDYQFCTDEDVGRFDPMCAFGDAGGDSSGTGPQDHRRLQCPTCYVRKKTAPRRRPLMSNMNVFPQFGACLRPPQANLRSMALSCEGICRG